VISLGLKIRLTGVVLLIKTIARLISRFFDVSSTVELVKY
jgi:hypothetical protein